jgi:regulator of replication initiation timing
MLENRPAQARRTGPEARQLREQLASVRDENARLRNENGRLRAALDRHTAQVAAEPSPYAARELTAGTCIGPGRRWTSEAQARRKASPR